MFVNTFEIKDPVSFYDKAVQIALVLGLATAHMMQIGARTFLTVRGEKEEIEAFSDVMHTLNWVA